MINALALTEQSQLPSCPLSGQWPESDFWKLPIMLLIGLFLQPAFNGIYLATRIISLLAAVWKPSEKK